MATMICEALWDRFGLRPLILLALRNIRGSSLAGYFEEIRSRESEKSNTQILGCADLWNRGLQDMALSLFMRPYVDMDPQTRSNSLAGNECTSKGQDSEP